MSVPQKAIYDDANRIKGAIKGCNAMSSTKQIEDTQRLADELTKKLDAAYRHIATVENERKQLVGPACEKEHKESQKRIREIDDVELPHARQTAKDLKERLSIRLEEIAEAKRALALAEWEEGRDKVREMLEARLTGSAGQRFAAALESMLKAFGELSAECEAVASELLGFDSRLDHEAETMRELPKRNLDILTQRLDDFGVPTLLNWSAKAAYRKLEFSTLLALAINSAIMELRVLAPPACDD